MVPLCIWIVYLALFCVGVNGVAQHDVNLSDGTRSDVEMVVVAYREDLSWIDPFLRVVPGMKLKLYCVGGMHPERRCTPVPNLQDSNPYFLKHIIDNYDRLANITLFTGGSVLRGEWDWLICKQLNYLVHQVNSANKRSTLTYAVKPVWRVQPEFDIKFFRAYTGGPVVEHCRPTVAPFGAWFETFVFNDTGTLVKSGTGLHNTQAVSADRIRKYPKSVYQSLYDELARCAPRRATAAHYMERAWTAMWGNPGSGQGLIPDRHFQCPTSIKVLRNRHKLANSYGGNVISQI